MSQSMDECEDMEGQEEWLSEGLLTDDDLNPTADLDRSDSNLGNTSQEDNQVSGASMEVDSQELQSSKLDESIEKTLDNMDKKSTEDELDTFLVKKSEVKQGVDKKVEDDGNDSTDDLLRLLEEGDEKKKKVLVKTGKDITITKITGKKNSIMGAENEGSSDEDDDEFIFKGAKVTRLKVAKNALKKKIPVSKAEPEDMSEEDDDETDASSEEAMTLKKTVFVKKVRNVASKSTSKPPLVNRTTVTKKVVIADPKAESPVTRNLKPAAGKMPSEINKRSSMTNTPPKPILRTMQQKPVQQSPIVKKTETKQILQKKPQPTPPELEEIINEEEFLEEDDFDLDEDFTKYSDTEPEPNRDRQMIMRPEQMDEEIPTDGESDSDDGSLYDELPSSESDEMDDWFTLDIRAERAGEYIPLLGSKAMELLQQEKLRVEERLADLRQSLTSLGESGRQQAEKLRRATLTLSELDDMLKAT